MDLVSEKMLFDVNVHGLVLKRWILKELDTALIVIEDHSRLQFCNQLVKPLAVLVAMYFTHTKLNATEANFLLNWEITPESKLKQHLEVLSVTCISCLARINKSIEH